MTLRRRVANALPLLVALIAAPAVAGVPLYKGQPITKLLSFGGHAAFRARQAAARSPRALVVPGLEDDDDPFIDPNAPLSGFPSLAEEGGKPGAFPDDGSNVFVNDPCLDPAPPNRARTVQSETEIAVLSSRRSHGKKMVVGYNDSFGFYNNRQGLSGFSYSTDGGKNWIDGGGLPPAVPSGQPCNFTPGHDCYFGDPVVAVHNATETFYFASLYLTPEGFFTVAVNRGHFRRAPPQTPESRANTRCAGNPAASGVPDPPPANQERIVWEPPVVAVPAAELGGGPSQDPDLADSLDKEWLYVDQRTGVLYLTYTRFGFDGSTPIEMVRSFDMGETWTPPSIIVPNLDDTFNQATQPVVTRTGRVIVTWHSRTFALVSPFPEISQRIEVAFSNDDGATFGPTVTVTPVNPQGEPLGYNRRRVTILDAPYIAADRFGHGDDQGDDDSDDDDGEHKGAGNVYITYFDGKTKLPQPLPSPLPPGFSQGPGNPFARSADIKLSTSRDGGATWGRPVKVSSDDGHTTHVFPSVQVNKAHKVFVAWTDRRLDPQRNVLNDVWAAASNDQGRSFGRNVRVTNVSTSWFQRADARPNFGDYNSSELINFDRFVTTWADGRFPPGTFVPASCTPPPPPGQQCPPTLAGTPDTLFAIVRGLSEGDRDGD